MGPNSAIGSLLKECEEQVDEDAEAGVIESERGQDCVVEKILRHFQKVKEEHESEETGGWMPSIESDGEFFERGQEAEEESDLEEAELDWDSDYTMY
jgi:hypothetical protein